MWRDRFCGVQKVADSWFLFERPDSVVGLNAEVEVELVLGYDVGEFIEEIGVTGEFVGVVNEGDVKALVAD